MVFSTGTIINVIIFALAVWGFWVAKRIHDHKVKSAPLVCPVGFDCNAVVHSDYSKFIGIPVEVFGMAYYTFIALLYFCIIFMPRILPEAFSIYLLLISLLAFLFSLYLITVQVFILKKGCSWCFVSAFICVLIFVLTVWK